MHNLHKKNESNQHPQPIQKVFPYFSEFLFIEVANFDKSLLISLFSVMKFFIKKVYETHVRVVL